MHTLLWLQRDLRIKDNPSLEWAQQQGKPIVAVYIYSPEEDAPWSEGAASRWWLHHSLKQLADELASINIRLHFFKGNSVDIFENLFKQNEFNTLAWTNRIEPYRVTCEAQIRQLAENNHIRVKRFNDGLLKTPDEFLTASKNTPYKVFTPFYRKLRNELDTGTLLSSIEAATKKYPPISNITLDKACSLETLGLLDEYPWHEKLHRYWTPGESAAHQLLDDFIDQGLHAYMASRDIPSINGTSRLSPHLHFGEISPQQVVNELVPFIENVDGESSTATEGFLRQLIWREFARYILWHFPHTVSKPMNEKFNGTFWKNNASALRKWQQGKTGISLVDAGMKQLWETGSMHNRVRMLVASLLTKNMGIAWQQGAQWFWDTLVDADLANNTMGWQWVAGCGVDAAPYFRIFNPETQAKKFDPQNIYTQQWLDNTAPVKKSVVDLASSRKHALERYQSHVRKGLNIE
jgi:deoxyribodipyrimidine photo-lyase